MKIDDPYASKVIKYTEDDNKSFEQLVAMVRQRPTVPEENNTWHQLLIRGLQIRLTTDPDVLVTYLHVCGQFIKAHGCKTSYEQRNNTPISR